MFNKKSIQVQRKAILIGKEFGKKKKEECKKENRKIYEQFNTVSRKKVIALTSAYSGAGSTYISLASAYSLSKEYSVALVECSNQELEILEQEYECKPGNLNSTRLDNLDVYFKGKNTLIEILKEPYDFIFLDLGKIDYSNKELMNEIYRADEKIIITQLSDWKQKYLNDFLNIEMPLMGWTIVTNLTSEENYKKLRKILKDELNRGNNNILQMPYTEDVFKYQGDIIKLLKGESRG